MSKVCSNCHYENGDKDKFCHSCGAKLEQGANVVVTNNANNIKQKEQYKTAALVFGVLSLFMGIITSIIGIVLGVKYRGKYNKNCTGYVLSLVTFILKVVLYPILLYTFIIVASRHL